MSHRVGGVRVDVSLCWGESDQFHCLCDTCLAYRKGSVGLILNKVSVMRVTISIDLSTSH
jgi:hypothetical protein